MKQLILLIFVVSFVACDGQRISKRDVERTIKEQQYEEECSNFYLFANDFIDLRTLKQLDAIDIPPLDFKYCSKYAHRFNNELNDTIEIGPTTWILDIDNKKNKYILISKNKNGSHGVHVLPVTEPVPDVHEYRGSLIAYGEEVIVLLEDWYDTKYIVCKYGGKEKKSVEIENTYITHPGPNTNQHNRYLYYHSMTASQLIFTSHMAFADKFVTRVLNLDDFTVAEHDKMAHGTILDEDDKELVGFVTSKKDYDAEKQPVKIDISMIDGKEYSFSIDYGDEACEILMKDSLLYVGNYHPIATGSTLHCFDMRTGKMKWTADVLQVNASHSEYWNKVTLTMWKNKIIMQGDEAYGSYLQVFDAGSGKRLAHFGNVMEEKK